jgi:hypothetical protein
VVLSRFVRTILGGHATNVEKPVENIVTARGKLAD